MWRKTIAVVFIMIMSPAVFGQTPPFATGLRGPIEVAFTRGGNLLVVEGGNGPNSGRLSIVERTTGARRTLIEALPSGIHQGPTPSTSGPSGVALQGSRIYVVIGNGDSVQPGPLPGTEKENENPSSPILSSLLELTPSFPLDAMTGGFTLAPGDHSVLDAGNEIVLTNGVGEQLAIRLVVDFPNFTPEPRPDFPANVRLANTFGVALLGQTAFVVDSSHNLIRKVDTRTGAFTTLTTFANRPNPVSGVGGPFIEAVPTAVRLRGGDLLVTTLAGFPFPPGSAEIRRVSLDGASNTTFIGGLTSAIDLIPLGSGPESPIAVLEFSANQLAGVPGRLSIVSPSAGKTVLAEGLITPTGLAVDQRSGEIFVAHLGPGIITRIDASGSLPRGWAPASIPVGGSVNGAFGSRFTTTVQMTNPFSYPIFGQLVFRPQGAPAGAGDRELAYELDAFESVAFSDIGAAFGVSGIGAIDIEASGDAVPEVIATVSGSGSGGNALARVPIALLSDAVTAGARSVLMAPHGSSSSRMNIGIRALDSPATIEVGHYSALGQHLGTTTHHFQAATFVQVPARALLGDDPAGGDVIVLEVLEGGALIYGSTTENSGEGLLIQIARPVAD